MPFLSNIRFSLRILRKHWKLSGIAIFSLSIGMAAGTTGFSIFNALLLRPPAVAAPEQLVTVYASTPTTEFNNVCYDDYKYYRDNNHVFSGVLAFPYSIALTRISVEHRSTFGLVNSVSDNYFSVLGVRPALGRTFMRGDDDTKTAAAVLSYPYWKWLGSDPAILGKSVTIGRVQLTIVGVMPKNFAGTIFSDLPDVWYPLSMDAAFNPQGHDWRTDRNNRLLGLIGRLKPGATRQQARADLQTLSKRLEAAYPNTNKDRVAKLSDTRMIPPDSVGDATTIASILLAVVALVLFAACSNVANLLLALTSARRHEILVRAALGATRVRLIRQVLFDSALVAIGGGTCGYCFAALGMRQLLHFKPYIPGLGLLPLTIDFRPDGTVVAVSIVLMLLAGVATGLVPGLYASTPNLAGALSGEIAIGGTRKGRVRNGLVAIQVAACTLVLIGMGLCARSLSNLWHTALGFDAHNLAIMNADPQTPPLNEEQGRNFHAKMRLAASQVYGVASVTLASSVPVSNDGGSSEQVRIEGSELAGQHGASISYAVVDDAYFSTLGIPLLAGRGFAPTDVPKGPEVIVVNHLMAEKYWPGQNPIGKTARIENGNRLVTVVGIVGDGKYIDVDESPQPFMYFDLNQRYQPTVCLIARTAGNPRQWLVPLSSALSKLSPDLDFQGLTMSELIDFDLYVPRITLICITAFGALAFLLAAVGLYGAVFYSVSERKKELGIRVALGAEPRDLWRMILRQTSIVTAGGVSFGILAGIVASALVRSLLYGIHPVEWLVLVFVALAMGAMTVLTAYSAARRWLQADPMESVRHA